MIKDTLNRPLRDLRISVIDRCNFRCPYCMPQDQYNHSYQFLNRQEWLSFDEIFRLARIFVDLGVRKIRLTGGEPLLRPGIDDLISRLVQLEGLEDLALTTNGSMLSQWAPRLKRAGLKRLTVSLDSLDPGVFKALSGNHGNVEDVLEGIKSAESVGFKSIKINTVVKRGVNDHTVLDLIEYFRCTNHTLRFIEYMDVGNKNQWDIQSVVTTDELKDLINKEYPLKALPKIDNGETASRYALSEGQGEIGFISSVSHAFCGDCNRLRLSADGKMYTCLFATSGTDLKSLLRQHAPEASLISLISTTWNRRQDQYSQLRHQRQGQTMPKVEMYHIGG